MWTAVAPKGSQPFVPAQRSSSSLTQEQVSLFSAILQNCTHRATFTAGSAFGLRVPALTPVGEHSVV